MPIPKPHSDSVRPLAVPETIYNLAGLVVLESISHAMPDIFGSVQLGCGVRGGVEIALHRTQLALERGGPDTVTLRLDFRNAFNERSGRVIAQALARCSDTSPLWRFFTLAYGRPSRLGVYSRGRLIREFLADEGVRQGRPIASFLFALSVQSLYTDCVKDLTEVEAYAIADDLTMTGPAMKVLEALERLLAKCAVDGPVLNLGKCRALWPYPTLSHPSYAPFAARLTELGIAMRFDCIDMLGGTVGLGMSRAPHTHAVVASHDRFFAGLAHEDMPTQLAQLLMRNSGVPLFTYLTRITPPAVILDAARAFDERLFTAVAAKLGLPPASLDNNTQLIITTPLRYGGLGFRPHTSTSTCAYYASIANAMFHIRGPLDPDELLPLYAATDTAHHVRDCHGMLLACGLDPNSKQHKWALPAVADDTWRFFSQERRPIMPHLQQRLSTAMRDHMYIKSEMLAPMRLSDDDADEKTQSTASLWLTSVPSSASTFMSDKAFAAAIRHRYGLPCRDDLPNHCHCGALLASSPAHFPHASS